ncbi:MAG: 3-isopropylmalate dehydratase large subunit [Burkholderiales bacterium]
MGRGQTITEKILSRVCGRAVKAGEIIYPEPDLITTHDWYVVNIANAFKELGVERLYAPEKLLISTDHEPVATSPLAVTRQKQVREIVERFGIKHFFDVGRGGHGHVFPMELGYIKPGMFVGAYDIHVTNYGAVGCLGIPVVTEVSELLACGSVWLRVPHTIRVNLHGKLARGTTMRDVGQKLIADLDVDMVDYGVIEYGGPALAGIDFAGRQVLCNTPIEIGAKSALIEPDQATLDYLRPRVKGPLELVQSDPDAPFRQVVDYDLNVVEPQVAVPPTPDKVVGISKVLGKRIHHAFIGSCAASSLADLRVAASVLKGRKIHPRVRFFVTPGTQEVLSNAEAEGIMKIFVDAGAAITAPGCGVCAGGKIGGLADDEVSINTGTRNDYGRLGSAKSEIYLANPATVAASAVAGQIADPREFLPQ